MGYGSPLFSEGVETALMGVYTGNFSHNNYKGFSYLFRKKRLEQSYAKNTANTVTPFSLHSIAHTPITRDEMSFRKKAIKISQNERMKF